MSRRMIRTQPSAVTTQPAALPGRRAFGRALLGVAVVGLGGAGLAACSVVPSQPYRAPRRFTLEAARPGALNSAPANAPILLVRSLSAAPGMDSRGLRSLNADGSVAIAPWDEWVAAPVDLAEADLRAWMQASGRFAAVIAPGSRLTPNLILEAQLLALQVDVPKNQAVAQIAGVLIRPSASPLGSGQVLRQFAITGTAPLSGTDGAAHAAAMGAAYTQALQQLEAIFPG